MSKLIYKEVLKKMEKGLYIEKNKKISMQENLEEKFIR